MREKVGLEGASESLDRGPVEPESLRECALDLCRGDGDGLQRSDDIGEPQPHELDATFLDRAKNEVALLVHPAPFVSPPRLLVERPKTRRTAPPVDR